MIISLKQTLSLTAASCLALAGSAFAKGSHGGGSFGSSPGNSSFGMSQRTELRTGSGNSSFGRSRAENARLRSDDADDRDDQDVDRDHMKTKKIKKTKLTNPGNSAFGRSQRINHLRGSGNNIHGKTVSANAKLKNANKKND
jgi:hypothetical protein